jgi:hypothetical protein
VLRAVEVKLLWRQDLVSAELEATLAADAMHSHSSVHAQQRRRAGRCHQLGPQTPRQR